MRPSSPLFLTLRLLADTGLLVKVVIKESIAVEENVRPRHEKYHICSLSYPPPPPSPHLSLPRSFGLYPTWQTPRFQDSEVPSSAETYLICYLCPLGALSPLSEVCGNLQLLLDCSIFCWANGLDHAGLSLQLQSPARIWPGGSGLGSASAWTVNTDLLDEDKDLSHAPLP